MNYKISRVALAILATTAVTSVYATESTENDALAITNAKISLTQAITTAEQHVGGQASRAEYEHEKNQSLFKVEVIKGKSVMDVTVDPMSGKVIASNEDKADHNEDRKDHEDGDEDD